MKILILNQAFHPDVVSSGQHASDLASQLVERNHEVSVIASARAYDNPAREFPKYQVWKGVRIHRVSCFSFGKGARWRRALDYLSFFVMCFWRLLLTPRQDVVVTMTSPPLISVLGSLFTILKGGHCVFWVMDLNPDEAVAAGWLPERGFITRALEAALLFSLRRARKLVVLDRFMSLRISNKGCPSAKISVIPPWSHDADVGFDPGGRLRFRAEHGLSDKFVVMYSGNHSPCHPLGTLLDAADRLSAEPEFAFLFVGGGSCFSKVQSFARERSLSNILCLPYQDRSNLSASLSSADLHVVILGDPFVGIVHPCKIYNILSVGAPVLYIGPSPSHITDLLPKTSVGSWAYLTAHGDVEAVIADLRRAASRSGPVAEAQLVARSFSEGVLASQLCEVLEATAG